MSEGGIPEGLAEAFSRLCQGDLAHRLPRTMRRDEADSLAFFFNSVADEIERIVRHAKEQEARLSEMTERLSEILLKVASGDLSVQAERDGRGDAVDVLIFLVNNTVAELAALVRERERERVEERDRLSTLVGERTAQLRVSEENFRQLFDASPVALVLSSMETGNIVSANAQAAGLFGIAQGEVAGLDNRAFWEDAAARVALVERVRVEGTVDGFEARLVRRSGEAFWCSMAARIVHVEGKPYLLAGTRDISEQKRLEAQLRELAVTDGLTGALNRRRIFEVAEEMTERALRYGRPFSLAMLDLDHFKKINDRFGHGVGDEALREVAEAIRKELRRSDHLGRYGGEELVVLFPETAAEEARIVTERIRRAVEGLDLTHEELGRVPLSLSAGVVDHREGEVLAKMLSRADAALYVAKSAGRNRVVAA